jgi:hypothetical protein
MHGTTIETATRPVCTGELGLNATQFHHDGGLCTTTPSVETRPCDELLSMAALRKVRAGT